MTLPRARASRNPASQGDSGGNGGAAGADSTNRKTGRLSEQSHQVILQKGFSEKSIEAGLAEFVLVLVKGAGADSQNNGPGAWTLSRRAVFEAVEAGHVPVEEHDGGMVFSVQFQGFGPRRRLKELESHGPEHFDHEGAVVGQVVDDQSQRAILVVGQPGPVRRKLRGQG